MENEVEEVSKINSTSEGLISDKVRNREGRTDNESQQMAQDEVDGTWAWVVALATFIITNLSSIPMHSYGVLFSDFLLNLETSTTTSSWIFSLGFMNTSFLCALVGPVVEEWGWQRVGVVLGMLYGMGFIMSAFAPSAEFLFFSYSLITCTAVDTLDAIAYLVIPLYFRRWLGVANGIVMSGVCTSQILVPPLLTLLQAHYGYTGATLIMGGVVLNCCVAALLIRPLNTSLRSNIEKIRYEPLQNFEALTSSRSRSNDKKVRNQSLEKIKALNASSSQSSNKRDCNHVLGKIKALHASLKRIFKTVLHHFSFARSPRIVLIPTIFALNSVTFYSIWALVPFAMESAGYSQEEAAFCLSVSGMTNFTSRLLIGIVSLCFSYREKTICIFGSLFSGISIIVFGLAEGVWWRAACLGGCGAGYGAVISLFGLMVVEELGLELLPPAFSISAMVSVPLFLIIGPLTGLVHDLTGSYVVTLSVLASILFLSVGLWFVMPSKTTKESQNNQYDEVEANPLLDSD